MNRVVVLSFLISLGLFSNCLPGAGADQISLQFQKKSEKQGDVALHSEMALPVSAMYPEYLIEGSTNLQNWETVAGPISGSIGVSDELLRVGVPLMGDNAFYRVVANVKLAPAGGGGDGEAIYGYGTEFSRELQSLGQLSLKDFVAMYEPTNQYLPQITFDPTTAEFWDLFNIDATSWNATNSYQNWRLYDFRLNPDEFAVFQTNGFVVSQRLERESFADVFYDIYTDDLPVFVTTDSILHAWHRSFVTMLAEIEETCFASTLEQIIEGMQERIPELWVEASGTAVTNGVLDADYYLAVAHSLSAATNDYGYLGQNARIAQTLQDIHDLSIKEVDLFGTNRWVDFSQFKVRGHYENSQILSNYFRAAMWCGFVDFRFSGETNELGVRELSGAVALDWLLDRSGQYSNWAQFDHTLEMFVGLSDSMNFAQLGGLLREADIYSPTNLTSLADLLALQDQLMSGELGLQSILSDVYVTTPFATNEIKLPRSFRFMGQRFVLDSWCLGKCVFDRILWDEDGIPSPDDLVGRRVPSALDVAFGVLGNNHIVPEIAERIARTNLTEADGRIYWRDGYPYQHNLAAVRNVVDKQTASAWTNSVYAHWLACLRELSTPTTGPEYPEALRTRAWTMKDLNTQLASWTELRHNTVLYAKQSYTTAALCEYPDGYVEPRPVFWERMREMALATKAVLATLSSSGVFNYTHYTNDAYDIPIPFVVSVSGATMYSNRLATMNQFLNTTETLRGISEKELSKTSLSTDETQFLQHLVEFTYYGSRTYTGWYPALFYEPGSQYVPPNQYGTGPSGDDEGSDYWDALVTDVHTDTFDVIRGDPGSVLHEGVGNVQLLMIAVDCGPGDIAAYAGPVLSHYEFELGPDTRMTDSEWKANIQAGTIPPQPDWTRSYLVPNP